MLKIPGLMKMMLCQKMTVRTLSGKITLNWNQDVSLSLIFCQKTKTVNYTWLHVKFLLQMKFTRRLMTLNRWLLPIRRQSWRFMETKQGICRTILFISLTEISHLIHTAKILCIFTAVLHARNWQPRRVLLLTKFLTSKMMLKPSMFCQNTFLSHNSFFILHIYSYPILFSFFRFENILEMSKKG